MEINFYLPRQKQGKILAFADVALAEGITVRGFRVVDGEKGVFVAVPSRSFLVAGEQRFANQVVFASSEIRERFFSEVLERFWSWREKKGASGEAAASGEENEVPF